MKDKIAMKIYDNIETKIEKLINEFENQTIKSITGYQFYYGKFKWQMYKFKSQKV